jgi:DNA-binding NtrC family response regulator
MIGLSPSDWGAIRSIIAVVSSEENVPTTLLVVDDEPQLLRLMVRVLERGKFRVLSASDADEAMGLVEAHQHEIGLVVLDVILPPNGIDDLLEHLISRHGEVPIVLTSGDTLDDAMREQLEACRGVFLRKPFMPKLLLQTVQECLAVGRSAAAGIAERS